MEIIIKHYLDNTPFSPEHWYSEILKYVPSYVRMRDLGFPLISPVFPYVITVHFKRSIYSHSRDPFIQQCKRCKKALSLPENDWYFDVTGCLYHPGKRQFSGGPEHGLYSCCKGEPGEIGCARHDYHICEFRPIDGRKFVSTAMMRPPGLEIEPCFDSRNIFALDCEMVFTTIGMEVVRVTLVSILGDIAYDSLVLPENLILDFNTIFTGVKAEDMEGVTTTLAEAQRSLLLLLNSNSILIGHALESYLQGLHLSHRIVVDTSLVFKHERGSLYRHSLRSLVASYLNMTIDSDEHNSLEDAKASLALILHKVWISRNIPNNSSTANVIPSQPSSSSTALPIIIKDRTY